MSSRRPLPEPRALAARWRRARVPCLVVTSLLLGAAPPAVADEHVARPATASAAPAPPGASDGSAAGWTLVVLSLAVGTAVTLTGLTIDCAERDRGCQRRSSLAIAGGAGIASIGSAIGLSLVQAAEVRGTAPLGARLLLAPRGEVGAVGAFQRTAGAMLVFTMSVD